MMRNGSNGEVTKVGAQSRFLSETHTPTRPKVTSPIEVGLPVFYKAL